MRDSGRIGTVVWAFPRGPALDAPGASVGAMAGEFINRAPSPNVTESLTPERWCGSPVTRDPVALSGGSAHRTHGHRDRP